MLYMYLELLNMHIRLYYCTVCDLNNETLIHRLVDVRLYLIVTFGMTMTMIADFGNTMYVASGPENSHTTHKTLTDGIVISKSTYIHIRT